MDLRTFTFAASAALTGLFPQTAAARVNATLSLSTNHLFGDTRYHISFPYIEEDIRNTGESRLEFPFDLFLGGVQVSVGEHPVDRSRWSVVGLLRRSIDRSGSLMKDYDWLNSRLISYSESTAGLTAWEAALQCRLRLLRRGGVALSAVAAYRFSRFSYKLYGLEGWYDGEWFGEGAGREFFVLDAGQHVLDYRVSYHLPLAGMSVEFHPLGWLETELDVLFSPHTLAGDFDDHLLRMKTARADGSGHAHSVGLNLQANLPSDNTRHELFVELRFEWAEIETDGHQKQEWYGDDPLTADLDDTGVRVTGIDDVISATMRSAGARVGWRF